MCTHLQHSKPNTCTQVRHVPMLLSLEMNQPSKLVLQFTISQNFSRAVLKMDYFPRTTHPSVNSSYCITLRAECHSIAGIRHMPNPRVLFQH